MRRLIACLIACAALLPVGTVSAHKSSPPVVVVPCGVTQVVYTQNVLPASTTSHSLTLTFQSSGAGYVTFTANNWQDFYYTQAPANCGSCSLTLPNVPSTRYGTVQVALDVHSDSCPSAGVTVTNFSLQIGSAH